MLTKRTGVVAILVLTCTCGLGSSQRRQGSGALGACGGPPSSPTGLTVTIDSTTHVFQHLGRVELRWRPAAGSASSYIIESQMVGAGSLTTDTGSAATEFASTAEPGDYRVQIRAKNRCGTSDPSEDVRFTVRLTSGMPDVIVVPRSGERGAFFPTIERLANGHLVVVYYDSPDHITPLGRISMVRSTDEGKTWSAPQVIIDTPLDDRSPSIMQARDGPLLFNFWMLQHHTSEGVFVLRSRDEGRTWSQPLKVGTTLIESSTEGKIVELENGDLLIPIAGRKSNEEKIRCTIVRSTDHGNTWPAAQEVELAAVPGVDVLEPVIANLGGGRLLGMVRSENDDNRAYLVESHDFGRSWSKPVKVPISAQASDLVTVAPRAGRGSTTVVHTWGDFSHEFAYGRPTLIQRIEIGKPGTAPIFGPPRLVYHGRCSWGDESYPSSVLLADDRVFTVYYDACTGYIGGTFTSFESLEAPRKPPTAP